MKQSVIKTLILLDILDPLTFIGLRVWVLDVSGEFGENIHACCVGLWVASSQTGIPKQSERSMMINIHSSHQNWKCTWLKKHEIRRGRFLQGDTKTTKTLKTDAQRKTWIIEITIWICVDKRLFIYEIYIVHLERKIVRNVHIKCCTAQKIHL